MLETLKRRWRRRAVLACAVASVAGLAGLTGCAVPDPSRAELGRYKVALPAGDWSDIPIGTPFAAPPALGEPGTLPLRSRAWGLRGADGSYQAVALLHVGDASRSNASWARACPAQPGVLVTDAAGASVNRIDCLRLRRWAVAENWLERNRPDLSRWVSQQSVRLSGAPAHVSHVFTTARGELLMLDVLVDQRLLRPQTRGNDDFLRAGLPAEDWSDRVAQALRQATGMFDGHLGLPAFPYPITTNRGTL